MPKPKTRRRLKDDPLGLLDPWAKQVGGDHYKKYKIQPMEYSLANGLNAAQHTAVKYITRYMDKGTPIEDLEKAKHTIDLLIAHLKQQGLDK
jgi:hypothetical protein